MMGDEADVQVEGSIATGTVKAEWYDKTEDSFVVLASVLTADGYFVTASKTVTIVDGHEGGEATCAQGAVCAVCGEVYSEPDPMNHAAMRHVEAKAATMTDEGNIEYWTCADCGRYFLDEAGEKGDRGRPTSCSRSSPSSCSLRNPSRKSRSLTTKRPGSAMTASRCGWRSPGLPSARPACS